LTWGSSLKLSVFHAHRLSIQHWGLFQELRHTIGVPLARLLRRMLTEYPFEWAIETSFLSGRLAPLANSRLPIADSD
jgi:hypothetical protein